MKRFLFAFGCLALFTAARAEYLESNVTIQAKLYSPVEVPDSGGFTIFDHTVTSFKTLDFINRVALLQSQPAYTSKARLIYRSLKTDTDFDAKFLIREKGRNDYILGTGMITLLPAPHVREDAEPRVEKGKTNSAGVGTVKYILFTDATFKPNGTDTFLKLTGRTSQTVRTIASKQYEGEILNISVISMAGAGSFDINPESPIIRNGYAEGTVKLSAPKITENP